MIESPYRAVDYDGASPTTTASQAAALMKHVAPLGFEALFLCASALSLAAQGDATGEAEVATTGAWDWDFPTADCVAELHKAMLENGAEAAVIDVLSAHGPLVEASGLRAIADDARGAGARSVWLLIAPSRDRCGYCIAASRLRISQTRADMALGAVARYFSARFQLSPVAPTSLSDVYSDRFSSRERDVLRWCAEGKTNWEAAQILGVSENTVRYHLKNAFRKLDATTRSSAISAAMARGVIAAPRGGRKAALEEVYRSFIEGDPAPLRAILADDVVLVATAPQDLFAHAGRYEGPDGVLAHAAAVDAEYACRRFLPRIIAEDGDEVAVYLEVELIHRATGRPMVFDCAHFWTFRGQKVVHYVELFNTAAAHRQIADHGSISPD